MDGSLDRLSPVELQEQIRVQRSGRPFLAYRDASGRQQLAVIEPQPKELWVGRGADAAIRLPDDNQVSMLHALLEIVGSECTLVDDGISRNGTYVNGNRLQGRRRLNDGDRIVFGQTQAVFRAPVPNSRREETQVAPPAAPEVEISPAQLRVLTCLCRPFLDNPGPDEGGAFVSPPTNPQIAEQLSISVESVKSHMSALFAKLEVGDLPQNQKRATLAARALQLGLVGRR